MNLHLLRSSIAFVVLGAAMAAHAQTYDATADFTAASSTNPNGVWSYGYSPGVTETAGYQFKAFDRFVNDAGPLISWYDSQYNTSNTPTFSKNTSSSTLFGIPAGAIELHAGPARQGDSAILRFTAASTGLFSINSQFFSGDSGVTFAYVVQNSNFTTPLAALGSTDNNPVYNMTLSLSLGDTIDFVVENNGNFASGSTPLSVQIAAVPEPGTVAFACLGLGIALGGVGIRRRRGIG